MPDVRMPDGTIIRNVPATATRAQIQDAYERARQAGEVKDKRPTSFGKGAVEGAARPVTNTARMLGNPTGQTGGFSPFGPLLGPLIDAGGQLVQAATDKFSRSGNTRGSTGGRITGEIAATLPLGAMRGGAAVQGAAQGMLTSRNIRDPREVATNVAAGAAFGKLGEQVGKRIVAPVAERIGRTAPARAVANGVSAAASKLTGRNIPRLPNPQRTAADRAVGRMAPQYDTVRQNVTDAADLGLPYSLADADPRLRTLAGSVARRSQDARALAENTFAPRALGQADRAVNAIDQYLAPITDIEARAAQIRQQASNTARPFYDEAFSRAAPIDEQVGAMLQSPAGKDALRRAYSIAQNEGRDPLAMGFNLNDQGEVVLQQAPSFETLDLVKKGLDGILEGKRNPITGKLDISGDPEAQAVNGLRARLLGKLDEINRPYGQARAAYQDVIKRQNALELGNRTLPRGDLPQRKFDAALATMTDQYMPEAQRGYATAMADTVNRQRLSANPYNAVYGSPLQQGKVGAMFPDGAPRFDRQYQLEGDMSRTATETLGGSPTAARLSADQAFDSGAGQVVSNGLDLATGGKLGLLRRGAQFAGDRIRAGSEARAAQIAPTLYNTDARAVLQYLDDLARKDAEAEVRRRAYAKASGLLGGPAAIGGISLLGQ